MPTYKYRREDGTTFEIRQRITADALETCPETGQSVERVITGGSGFHLKGGGWYADGYASPGEGGKKQDAASGDGASAEKTSGSGEAAKNGDGEKSGAEKKNSSEKKKSEKASESA